MGSQLSRSTNNDYHWTLPHISGILDLITVGHAPTVLEAFTNKKIKGENEMERKTSLKFMIQILMRSDQFDALLSNRIPYFYKLSYVALYGVLQYSVCVNFYLKK